MLTYSTRQAAEKLGITDVSLGHYIKVGKIEAPQTIRVGARNVHVWTDADIARVRKLLPKIANGRKTRYQGKQSAVSTKKQSGLSNPQSANERTQPRAAALQKPKKSKRKKD